MVKINSKYADKVEKFIAVKILNPKLSIRKFADAEGMPHQTLDAILIKHPEIGQEILKGIRERYHSKSINVDEALYQQSLKGDPRAARLWYEKMEDWNVKAEGGGKTIIVTIDPALLPMAQRKPGPVQIESKPSKTEIINSPDEEPAFELTNEDVDKFGEEKTDE